MHQMFTVLKLLCTLYYCNMIYGAKFSPNYYSIPEVLVLPHMNDGHDGGWV